MNDTTPPQTPWQKAADQMSSPLWNKMKPLIEQICRDHASRLEKENAELKAHAEKMYNVLSEVLMASALDGMPFNKIREALATHPTPESRKLPDPTPEQAACKHEKWKKATHPPRVCIECGLQMWDAGD